MYVLHITAHMGAGAGKAIVGMASADVNNSHSIVLLERPQKTEHIKSCEQHGIIVHICPGNQLLGALTERADVLVINWWHHPSVYKALMQVEKIPARIVLWSHINGLHYPALSARFADCFDVCMFTSKASMAPAHWPANERGALLKKSKLVYGMGDFIPAAFEAKQGYALQEPVRIGYVGTLNYAKMHPQFISWCKEILNKTNNIQIIFAGDPMQPVIEDVNRLGLNDKVLFLGFQKNIPALLKTFDLFAYLLNSKNFATTENALLEAMAVGLPIITSNGEAETAIISNGIDGLVVDHAKAFSEAVQKLMNNGGFREKIGKNARETVLKNYDLDDNIKRFDSIVSGLFRKEKRTHHFSKAIGADPFSWFLSGCKRDEAEFFEEAAGYDDEDSKWFALCDKAFDLGDIYRGKSKGSVLQYLEHFPQNRQIRKISGLYKRT